MAKQKKPTEEDIRNGDKAVCNDLAVRLATQQRLTEIATENLADANSLLAETYDYVGTKRLGSMALRIRAHLDSKGTP